MCLPMGFPVPSGITLEESIKDGTLSCDDADNRELLGTVTSGPATLKNSNVTSVLLHLSLKQVYFEIFKFLEKQVRCLENA